MVRLLNIILIVCAVSCQLKSVLSKAQMQPVPEQQQEPELQPANYPQQQNTDPRAAEEAYVEQQPANPPNQHAHHQQPHHHHAHKVKNLDQEQKSPVQQGGNSESERNPDKQPFYTRLIKKSFCLFGYLEQLEKRSCDFYCYNNWFSYGECINGECQCRH